MHGQAVHIKMDNILFHFMQSELKSLNVLSPHWVWQLRLLHWTTLHPHQPPMTNIWEDRRVSKGYNDHILFSFNLNNQKQHAYLLNGVSFPILMGMFASSASSTDIESRFPQSPLEKRTISWTPGWMSTELCHPSLLLWTMNNEENNTLISRTPAQHLVTETHSYSTADTEHIFAKYSQYWTVNAYRTSIIASK